MTFDLAKQLAQDEANTNRRPYFVVEGYDDHDRMVWDVTDVEPCGQQAFTAAPEGFDYWLMPMEAA